MSKTTSSILGGCINHICLTGCKSSGPEGLKTVCAALRGRVVHLACLLALAPVLVLADRPAQLISHQRLVDDIYESVYSVRTGKGQYDRIQVHRVVREDRGEPRETDKAVMLLHGDVWGFGGAFLGAGSPSSSIGVYLARRGADVWGVDLAWTLVPKETTDFTFMKTWDMQHDIDGVGEALDLARNVRKRNSPLPLLAWSRGGWIGYGLLNQESQLPCPRRRVSGFIPVDTYLKTNDAAVRSYACSGLAFTDGAIAAGNYVNSNTLDQLGLLAESNPTGLSPFFPGATNYDASLLLGAAPFPSFTPYYHFVGGVFPQDDTTQTPAGLQYTDVPRWNAFLKAAGTHQSMTMIRDSVRITCQSGPSGPYDDHLSDIKVPVLYVAAAGGFETYGDYTLSLLGSRDIESHVVRLRPPGQEALDFAHVDLFYARDADDLVWRKIDRWLESHADDRPCSGND